MPRFGSAREVLGKALPDFESPLPSGTIVRTGIPFTEAIARATYMRGAGLLGARAAEQLVSRVAVSAGMPRYRLGSVRELVEESGLLELGKVAWQEIGPYALGALRPLLEPLASLGESIPYVKWIVAVLDGLGALARYIKEDLLERTKRKEWTPEDAIIYDRDLDEDVARRLLSATFAEDWTPIFLPPSYPLSGWHWGRADRQVRGITHEGWKAWPFHPAIDGRFGVVPGLGRIDGALVQTTIDLVIYDPPCKGRGCRRPGFTSCHVWPEEDVQGMGDILPAANYIGRQCWSHVTSNGPAMWRIDPSAIVEAWDSLYRTLVQYAHGICRGNEELGHNKGLGGAMATAASRVNWLKRGIVPQISESELDDYSTGGPPLVSELVAYFFRKVWEPRAWRALGTISCAYLSGDEPALRWARRARPDMVVRWRAMRELLLSHEARRWVDLALVPDADYRERLRQAQTLGPTDVAADLEAENLPRGTVTWGGEPELDRHGDVRLSDRVLAHVDLPPPAARLIAAAGLPAGQPPGRPVGLFLGMFD